MSLVINSTLQNKIEKGLIWTGGFAVTAMTSGTTTKIEVDVGSKKTEFILEIITLAAIQVTFVEEVTPGAGASTTDYNMDRSGSYSKETIVKALSSSTGGTQLITTIIPGGVSGSIAQFTGEVGPVLAANTNYEYSFTNNSGPNASIQLNWFYREIT